MDITKSFDRYVIQARIVPVLIVVFPLAALVAVWLPEESIGWKLLSSLVALVLLSLIAQLGRNPGKAKEAELFRKWGGKPSIRKLRYRDTDLQWITLERIRTNLAREVGIPGPTKTEEAADPEAADQVYSAWIDQMREATRGDRILHSENIGYGFCRNLWAMKPAGIVIGLIGLAAASVGMAVATDTASVVMASAVIFLDACLVTWWLFRVSDEWVRLAADAYADRLMRAYLGQKPEKQTAAA